MRDSRLLPPGWVRRFSARCTPAFLVLLIGVGPAVTQPLPQSGYPTPLLATVTPPGGQAGAAVEVTLGGNDLDELSTLLFAHPGFKVERLAGAPPSKTAQANPQPQRGRRQMGQPVQQATARFRVTVAADVPAGLYDVRAVGKHGISNPRAFAVGNLPEAREKEPNSDVPQAQRIELNSTVSGTVGANVDVDYYTFSGRKGQHVVVACAAFSIDSQLDPLVQVFDATGKKLAGSWRAQDRDAVLDLVLPADGDFYVRVCEFTYTRFGPEYYYRLTVTTGPWIDAAYPPVVEPGKTTEVTLFGRNLPGGTTDPLAVMDGHPLERLTVPVTPPTDPASRQRLDFRGALLPRSGGLDGFGYRVQKAGEWSNPVLLAFASQPVVLENEDNDTAETAQEVAVPCTLSGRIGKRGDRDRFVFAAKKGEVYVLEGFGDRLGSPVDLYFTLRRVENNQMVGEFDESTEMPPAFGRFWTFTSDPKARLTVSADGKYELMVSSRTASGPVDPRGIYAVSIRPERPDFRLVLIGNNDANAGGCTVRQGGSQDLQVVCFRQDGFNGEVTVTTEGLPKGVTCPPQVLGPNLRETVLVVSAAPDAAAWAGAIRVKATAVIDGKPVEREARAGCLVWPTIPIPGVLAFSRLSDSICLAVRDKGPFGLDVAEREMAVPAGGTAIVKVKVNRQLPAFKAPVQLVRVAGPGQPQQSFRQQVNQPAATVAPNRADADIRVQIPPNTPPGTYNLVFQGIGQMTGQAQRASRRGQRNVQYREVTPPIRLTVFVGVAQVVPANSKVAIQPGGEAALVVKVTRLRGFRGEFRLELVPPQGFAAVSAAPVTVPAGKNEARLVLKATADAKPSTNNAFLVRATATVDKKTVTQDIKITVTIARDTATVSAGEPKDVTLVAAGAAGWRYVPAAKVQGNAWRALAFNDASWATGQAPIGYGEEAIGKRKGTTISQQGQPILFRRGFEVPKEVLSAKGVTFRLAVASDDSAEVYVNGELVDRDPEADHEFTYWNREVDVPVKLLRPGKNVVAVHVKNGEGSSDLYLDLELTARVPGMKK